MTSIKGFLLFFLLCSTLSIRAQVAVTIYYNEAWQITIKKDAAFIREADVIFQDTALVWNGTFTDSSIDGRLIRKGTYRNNQKQGQFEFFHDNTVLESTGTYDSDQLVGEWNYYNDHGGTKQVVTFSGKDFSIEEFFDSRDRQLLADGTGNWKLFVPFGDRVVSLDAYFAESQRTDRWIYRYSPGGKILVEEYDEDGNLIEGIDYEKKGNPTYQETKLTSALFEVPSLLRAEQLVTDDHFYGLDAIRYIRRIGPKTTEYTGLKPTYRDGIEEFYNYVLQNYRYPASAFEERLEGQVIIDFLVDDQGGTSDFRVMRGVSQELNAEAVRLISSTDGWVPAMHESQPVSSRMSVPITFKLN